MHCRRIASREPHLARPRDHVMHQIHSISRPTTDAKPSAPRAAPWADAGRGGLDWGRHRQFDGPAVEYGKQCADFIRNVIRTRLVPQSVIDAKESYSSPTRKDIPCL